MLYNPKKVVVNSEQIRFQKRVNKRRKKTSEPSARLYMPEEELPSRDGNGTWELELLVGLFGIILPTRPGTGTIQLLNSKEEKGR